MSPRLPRLEDDGLLTPEVSPYAEQKYRLIAHMAAMVGTSMKSKWGQRVYLDLYCGPGRARLRRSNEIIPASPILALGIPDPFDRYIFCDVDVDRVDALKSRVVAAGYQADCRYLPGDSNVLVEEILRELPPFSREQSVLTLCVADPYRMEDLRFETLAKLSERYVDFLVLIPSYMDANRNELRYSEEANKIVDAFLGNQSWRGLWAPGFSNWGPIRRLHCRAVYCPDGGAWVSAPRFERPGADSASAEERPALSPRLLLETSPRCEVLAGCAKVLDRSAVFV